MNLGTRYNTLFYILTAALLLLVVLAIPGVDDVIAGILNIEISFKVLTDFLKMFGPLVLNLYGILLVGFVVNLSIGLEDGVTTEVLEAWNRLHLGLRIFLIAGLVLVVIANLLSLLNLMDQPASSTGEPSLMATIGGYFGFIPVAGLNFVYMLVFSVCVAFGHSRAPAWKHIQVPDKMIRTKSRPGTTTLMLSPQDRKLLRKAERFIEKEKLFKAAKIFERLGDEFYYRAGKFYSQKGHEDRASKAFAKAGEYYLQRGNFPRAADSFYFGRHWHNAAQTYQRFMQHGGLQEEAEQVQNWASRWGESLYMSDHFEDAARVYSQHGIYKKAGEAYERAGLGERAAKEYNKAGALDSSYKALEKTGHTDLAKLQKGRYLVSEGKYAEAAELFESGHYYEQAAHAFEQAGIPSRAARCYRNMEEWERAAEAYLSAGEEVAALEMYEQLGDFKKAASLASEMGIRDKQALYHRKNENWLPAARSYIMAGDVDAARECLQKVPLDNEENVAQCANILELLYEQERFKEAISCAKGLLEGKKTRRILAPLLFCLARVYERLGNAEEMNNFFFKAANMAPDNQTYLNEAIRVARLTGVQFTPRTRAERSGPSSGPSSGQVKTDPLPIGEADRKSQEDALAAKKERQPTPEPVEDKVVHTDGDDGNDITLTLDEQTVFDLTQDGALERYQVIKELGKGGMGYVYKARDKKLKRFVALKMLYPEYNNDARVLLFFKREAMAVASLNHPNLVHLFDAGQEKGCFYMVMEYVEGSNLQQLLTTNRGFMGRNLIAVWYQACLGLKYAHEHGIIHRDIKPSNIMLARDRRVKVLDFGLAKEAADLSQTQQIWGTPSFMAPELFQGERASFQTDIYGLGATFYMLATGHAPFSKDDLPNKLKGNGLPRPPHELNGQVSQELSATILKCMYLNPSDRFTDMDQLLKRIRSLGKKR